MYSAARPQRCGRTKWWPRGSMSTSHRHSLSIASTNMIKTASDGPTWGWSSGSPSLQRREVISPPRLGALPSPPLPLTPTHPPETVSIIPRLWLAPDPNGRFTGSVPVVSGGPPATPHTDAKRATKKTRAITTLAIVSSFPRALLNDGVPQSTDKPYRCQWSAARGSELTN